MIAAAAVLTASCTGGGGGHDGAATHPPTTGQPVESTLPAVSVDGPSFVTSEGSSVQLRGVSLHSLDPAVYQRAPALGVNFVRLAVPWSDYQPHGPQTGAATWDTQRLAELDAAIRFFGRHHIQVLIDLHQYGWSPYFSSLQRGSRANGIPSWVYHGRRWPLTEQGRAEAEAALYTDRRATQLYGDFAAMLAKRYRGTPNVVGYEILNEPQLGDMPRQAWAVQRIVRWQSLVAAAIRAVDPDRVIVFMVPPRSDLDLVRLWPLQRLGPLALDVHDYSAGTGTRGQTTLQGGAYRGTFAGQAAYLAPYVSQAKAWKVPLIVGEWGAFSTAPGVDEYQRQMVRLFSQEGISWARWSLDDTERLGLLRHDGQLTAAGVQLGRLIAAESPQ